MEEEAELGLKDLLLKYKYYFLAGFIVLMLISFLIGFFIGNKQTVSEIEEIYTKAVQNKNPKICEKIHDEKREVHCKIFINAELNNSAFCNSLSNKLEFSFQEPSNEIIIMSSSDYCWLTMSEFIKQDFCTLIKNIKAKEACFIVGGFNE